MSKDRRPSDALLWSNFQGLKAAYEDKCDEIKRLRERVAELEREREIKISNEACGDALDFMWRKLFDKSYGDWEYPGQAARHIIAVVNELGVKLKERDNEIEWLREERDKLAEYLCRLPG